MDVRLEDESEVIAALFLFASFAMLAVDHLSGRPAAAASNASARTR